MFMKVSTGSLHLPSGMTVAVRREPATGAMVLQEMLYLRPSIASVLASPSIPNFAAARKQCIDIEMKWQAQMSQ
jgi:hypothetical protein